jgi:BirA family biotin operon repressor/biotin-[acetyl-CoA-carboxylase] ligase
MVESLWDIHTRGVVESTNEVAKELVSEGAGHGTVVVAERQVRGKGRHGRKWASPKGGLYVSIVVEPAEKSVQLLSLFSGIPVVKVLRSHGCLAGLQWPNDVMVEGRKIGGILGEGIYRHRNFQVVVGIGINNDFPLSALPTPVAGGATTIREETRKSVPNEELLDELLREYSAMLDVMQSRGGARTLIERYKAVCVTLGKRVLVQTDRHIEGIAVDVNPEGYLVIERPSGEKVHIPEGWLERVYWS